MSRPIRYTRMEYDRANRDIADARRAYFAGDRTALPHMLAAHRYLGQLIEQAHGEALSRDGSTIPGLRTGRALFAAGAAGRDAAARNIR